MRQPTVVALLRVRNLVVFSNLNVNSLSAVVPSRAVVVIVLLLFNERSKAVFQRMMAYPILVAWVVSMDWEEQVGWVRRCG
ncbi:hypothetical protein ACFX12_007196 [Malus domestica]